MNSLKGQPVVQYHNLFYYFLHRFQIPEAGTIERLPGIPPAADHILKLEEVIRKSNIKIIIQDVYHSDDAAKLLTSKNNLRLIYLPHDVGSTKDTENIFSLFNEIVRRLTHD